MARPRAQPHQPPPPQPGALPCLHANAAGMEVGATSHGVAVLADRDANSVRECGPLTFAGSG